MSASLRRASPGDAPGSAAAFHAPLFHELVAGMGPNERHVVLDLGAASTAMLALLGRSRSRVEIADLAHFGGIERLNATAPGPRLAGVAESLLPNRLSGDPVDLVFCWDIPNYLTLNALSALMDVIGERARPGALLHTLIFYAEHKMDRHPGCFVPTDNCDLHHRSANSEAVAAPRYSPEDLGNSMGRFRMDRARLLANGMQEFLFRLEA